MPPRAANLGGQRMRGAFTLLELVLSLSVLSLLAGVAIGTFWGALSARKVQASGDRLCSLLRSARAEAANVGRCFRLSFEGEPQQPVLAIEQDPLAQPGTFTPYPAWWVEEARLTEGVRVVLCRRTGDSAFAGAGGSLTKAGDAGESDLDWVTFYPDGSSDSARIVLASDDQDHPWALEITLNGVDGSVASRQIDTEEEPIEPIR